MKTSRKLFILSISILLFVSLVAEAQQIRLQVGRRAPVRRPSVSTVQPNSDYDFVCKKLPDGWCSLPEKEGRGTLYRGDVTVKVVSPAEEGDMPYPSDLQYMSNSEGTKSVQFEVPVSMTVTSDFEYTTKDGKERDGKPYQPVTIKMEIGKYRVEPFQGNSTVRPNIDPALTGLDNVHLAIDQMDFDLPMEVLSKIFTDSSIWSRPSQSNPDHEITDLFVGENLNRINQSMQNGITFNLQKKCLNGRYMLQSIQEDCSDNGLFCIAFTMFKEKNFTY